MSSVSPSRRKLKQIVGRAERVDFPDGGVFGVHAKIDTGAYRTSVWASDIRVEGEYLKFKLLGSESEFYSGKDCKVRKFELVEVENSFGQKQERYSIFFKIRLGARTVRTNITLADRSNKTYPILIGRKLLKGRYLVDVTEGEPLDDEETMDI